VHGTVYNSKSHGFGSFGILLVGDFGQLPPVQATSLLGHNLQESPQSGLRARALQGQRHFRDFNDVICLKRVYRQKKSDMYKDSTVRLRDAVCTPDDWALWKTHELPDDDSAPETLHPDVLSKALHLTVENSVCGSINGAKLKAVSVQNKQDKKLNVILKCKATHNDDRARTKPASDFRNLRDVVHLCLLAPVMLIQNNIFGVNTVSLGLMNGARGALTLACANTYKHRSRLCHNKHKQDFLLHQR
jgi:hypothetical protein